MIAVPKSQAYRNPTILRAAKGRACTGCGANDGTTVAAHSNLGEDGKGVGLKSWDLFVAFLCYECHAAYDQKRGFTQDDFHRAMKKTWRILIQEGIIG